jgi:hypothetical protein
MRTMALILLSEQSNCFIDESLANVAYRGFQSIGSYHATPANGIAVAGALKSR